MTWDFKVGDKVVCVDDTPCICGCRYSPVVKNGIYTIEEIASYTDRLGRAGILIREVPPGKHRYFAATRFRPLVSNSTKLFRAIAQGVTDGKPIIDDPVFDPAVPTEALCRFMHKLAERV